MSNSNINKSQLLANRLDKISENFNIAESTIFEISTHVEDEDNDLDNIGISGSNSISTSDDTTVVDYSKMKNDFNMVRDNALSMIKQGKELLENIHTAIMFGENDEATAENVGAYASLSNVVNQSLKLLITNYQDVIKIQSDLKLYKDETNKNNDEDEEVNYVSINTIDIINEEVKQLEQSGQSKQGSN